MATLTTAKPDKYKNCKNNPCPNVGEDGCDGQGVLKCVQEGNRKCWKATDDCKWRGECK